MLRPAVSRRFFSRPASLRAAIILLLFAAVAGCGQSGPLYLPGNPSQVQEPPAEDPEAGDVFTPSNVEDDEDEDKDDDGR